LYLSGQGVAVLQSGNGQERVVHGLWNQLLGDRPFEEEADAPNALIDDAAGQGDAKNLFLPEPPCQSLGQSS
jgi:hypothetical protein